MKTEVLAEGAVSGEAGCHTRGETGVLAAGSGDVHIAIGLAPIERVLRDSVAANDR
ncbi:MULTISPECIES: hypothetical protein [unclassified Microbacterium]|uniref:hypothetical protein n=1 Tax=unclassified Microbacterium TaxID=2609290 RepID=UPI00214B4B3A|nr:MULTISPECIES: hypothetical protein [unclassified Microbacterium]MCR2800031.1 hypothetical protein [Microbacterium sp. zg.Y818]MCR2827697.1 hypothetical protein [Microbacterium sp. zg.Y909]WIM22007.1 hypothetical protein QNO21_12940 [Microbacterium sp. zg-Y818]